MFENLDYPQIKLIYLGLKAGIESKSGYGFCNKDMNHPVYHDASGGGFSTEMEYADSPEKNTLFKMLSEISLRIKNEGPADYYHEVPDWYDFSTWQDFCKFAIDVWSGKR